MTTIEAKYLSRTISNILPFSATSPSLSVYFTWWVLSLFLLSSFTKDILLFSAVLRAVTGFLLLSFVPGLLFLRIFKRSFRVIDIIYVIGLSVAFSMMFAWIINSLHHELFLVSHPFRNGTVEILFFIILVVGSLVSWRVTSPRESEVYPTTLFQHIDKRALLILISIPLLAISGARILNQTGSNTVLLVLIGICAILPLLALFNDRYKRYFGVVVLVLSFSLILQRSLIMTHLAFGDGVAEYAAARRVLESGYWIPGAAKDAMPRVGLLHPFYSLMMDIDLLWEFKIVHPVLFALTPFVGYKLAARYFSTKIAFLGSVLYIFLPETYRLLPRNTRTGSAIFFAVIFVAVILDSDLDPSLQRGLGFVFIWAIITSHYGLGPLFLMLLGPAVIFYYGLVLAGSKKYRMIGLVSISSYFAVMLSWYMYMTGGTFGFVISVIFGSANDFVDPTETGSAGNAISTEMPSWSYEILFYSHLLIAALACLSLALIGLLHLLHVHVDTSEHDITLLNWYRANADTAIQSTSYLSVMGALALLFPISFGPGAISSARTFGFLIVFLGPFAALLLRIPKLSRGQFTPIFIFLSVLLLFTSGFVSATVTNDLSRQPNLNRGEIIESDDTNRQYGLYKVYNSERDIHSSGFLALYAPKQSDIYVSRIGGFNPEFTILRDDLEEKLIREYDDVGKGYTLISEGDVVTGTITTQHYGFIYYDIINLTEFIGTERIYENGRGKVLIQQSERRFDE